jgi:hypothetical protein
MYAIQFCNWTSQSRYKYDYVIVTYKSESNSGLGCPKPDRYTTMMISQKDILVWDTFYFWMDGDPIPNRNFPNGIGRLPFQFWNWIDSGMGRNIYIKLTPAISFTLLITHPFIHCFFEMQLPHFTLPHYGDLHNASPICILHLGFQCNQ